MFVDTALSNVERQERVLRFKVIIGIRAIDAIMA